MWRLLSRITSAGPTWTPARHLLTIYETTHMRGAAARPALCLPWDQASIKNKNKFEQFVLLHFLGLWIRIFLRIRIQLFF